MVNAGRRAGMAFWGAWLLAGTAGSLLPVLPAALNLRFPASVALGLQDAFGPGSIVLGALLLAAFQCIVLGALRGRFSRPVLLWIPVSAGAALIAYIAIALWQVTIPRTLISVSAIQTALPSGFPLLQVIFALFGLANAMVLGLAQGLLLAKILEGRSVVGFWLVANLVAAILVGIVFGIRLQEPVAGDDATRTAMFLSNILINGALYAAVTGVVLVAMTVRRGEAAISLVQRLP